MTSKKEFLAAVVAAAERATVADAGWGRGSQHSAVGYQDLDTAIRDARAAGATGDEIRSAVAGNAFRA